MGVISSAELSACWWWWELLLGEIERDIGAFELENCTLRDLGTALEGDSLAAEEAVRCGVRGGELLEEARVAMMGRKEVEHRWRD